MHRRPLRWQRLWRLKPHQKRRLKRYRLRCSGGLADRGDAHKQRASADQSRKGFEFLMFEHVSPIPVCGADHEHVRIILAKDQ